MLETRDGQLALPQLPRGMPALDEWVPLGDAPKGPHIGGAGVQRVLDEMAAQAQCVKEDIESRQKPTQALHLPEAGTRPGRQGPRLNTTIR